MGYDEQRQLTEALARRAVAETAPKELPLFTVTARSYFADPDRAVAAATSKAADDEMLGFGVESAVAIVTPVALWVAQQVAQSVGSMLLQSVGTQVGAAVEAEAAGPIRSLVRRLLRMMGLGNHGADAPAAMPAQHLTPAQLSEVREAAFRTAREYLPEAQAKSLANAMVAELLPSAGA